MKFKNALKLSIIAFVIALSQNSYGQITIDNSKTNAQLVTQLLGSGVSASNIVFRGVRNVSSRYQVGSFSTATTTLAQMGFTSGVVLSTGNTSDIPLTLGTNPGSAGQMSYNYISGTAGEIRQSNPVAGQDADADNLLAVNYYNAAILEFDFVPLGNSVSFRYIFGSEEYSDQGGFINYQCSSYNDKFAFLISGPGIAGGQGYTLNARNIARLSNGAEVGINSVNSGVVGSSGGSPSAANCEAASLTAWVQNTPSPEFLGHIDGTQLNGNTHILTASQSGLTPGLTYHIRLLISDAQDGAYDAVVYLETGSFSSPAPSIGVTASPSTICAGSSTQLTAIVTSGTPNYTYTWSDGFSTIRTTTGTASLTDQFNVSPTVTTTYYVTVTDQGSPVQTSTGSVVVTVNSLPVVTASATPATICAGQTLNLSSTPNGATSYSWAGPNSFTSTSQNPTIAGTTIGATGIYTVTITNGGCSNTGTVSATVNALPIITASSVSDTVCAGQTINLTSLPNGGTSYIWSGPNSFSNASQNPSIVSSTLAATGIYTVTAIIGGCSNTATTSITVNPLPIVTVNSPTICSGASAVLTANGGTTYLWSDGSTLNSITVSPGSNTSYTVTGTTDGCSASAISSVIIGPSLSITVNSPTICNGDTIILTAGGGTTYSWSNGSTVNPISVYPGSTTSYSVTGTTAGCTGNAISTVSVTQNPTITVNDTTVCNGAMAILTANGGTTYLWNTGASTNPILVNPSSSTVYTVVGTTNGCTGTAISTVTVNPIPTITVNSPTICTNTSAILTANGGSTYSWSNGSTINPTTVNPTATTSYTVTGTSLGCTNTAISVVTVSPNLNITVNNPTICSGSIATLTALGGTTYEWSNGSSTNPISVSPVSTTSYTVTGTTLGCTGTTITTVTVTPLPIASINGDSLICVGASSTLTANGGSIYLWSNSASTESITVYPTTSNNYSVTVTNNGCSSTASYQVDIAPIPIVNAGSDTTITGGSSIQLYGSGGGTYLWTPSTGLSCTNCANPIANPEIATTYVLQITDANGCSNSDTINIFIDIECGEVFIPNVFSPNTDGKNDVQCVHGKCIQTMVFSIYDRWGEKVFESEDLSNCWDGNYKGKPLNTAVFVYYLKATMKDGTEVIKKGNITLIR